VSALSGAVLRRHGFVSNHLVTDWAAVVGNTIGTRSLPERLVHRRGSVSDGTLVVRVASGASALEVQHQEPVLIQRINAFLGYSAVTRVRVVQGVLPEVPPIPSRSRSATSSEAARVAAIVETVKNPGLRQALFDFGLTLLAHTRQDDGG
jgi:hypothetical protein